MLTTEQYKEFITDVRRYYPGVEIKSIDNIYCRDFFEVNISDFLKCLRLNSILDVWDAAGISKIKHADSLKSMFQDLSVEINSNAFTTNNLVICDNNDFFYYDLLDDIDENWNSFPRLQKTLKQIADKLYSYFQNEFNELQSSLCCLYADYDSDYDDEY